MTMELSWYQCVVDSLGSPFEKVAQGARPRAVAGRVAAALLVGAALWLGLVSPASAVATSPISPCVPSVIQEKGLQPVGALPASQHLHLALGLQVKDPAALEQFASEVSDPASSQFRHYLTPAQVAERFGPSQQDYDALVAFAQAHHLQVTGTCTNRIVLSLEGTVADIESAMHVRLLTYNNPTEGRTFFAPDVEPTLDVGVRLLTLSGLCNYTIPRNALVPRPARAPQRAPAGGSGPGGSYMGYDFRHAYIPATALVGSGQTVGVLEFDSGFFPSDISTYEAMSGLPPVPAVAVLLDGYDGGPGIANDECSLDIEMAIAMAPGIDQVVVYEGDQPNSILGRMTDDVNVKQFGASWLNYGDRTSDQFFQVMAAQGQSFYNASGDWEAWVLGVWPPGDNPYVMVVGGTTLYTDGNGAWSSEVVWNWGTYGTGGGISETRPLPPWQSGLDLTLAQGSTYRRNLPDIALTADNIFVEYGNGGQGVFGGTSCATPLWAGYTALVNQEALANNLPTAGFLNPVLYNLGKTTKDNCLYRDITVGNNTWSESPTKFYAVLGFDLCTGWGSPTDYLNDAINGLGTSGCLDLTAVATRGTGTGNASPLLVQPNPTSGNCSVSYNLPTPGRVAVAVMDVNGRIVRRLMEGDQGSGTHALVWDGRNDLGHDLPGGVYLARVQTPQGVHFGTVVLAR